MRARALHTAGLNVRDIKKQTDRQTRKKESWLKLERGHLKAHLVSKHQSHPVKSGIKCCSQLTQKSFLTKIQNTNVWCKPGTAHSQQTLSHKWGVGEGTLLNRNWCLVKTERCMNGSKYMKILQDCFILQIKSFGELSFSRTITPKHKGNNNKGVAEQLKKNV